MQQNTPVQDNKMHNFLRWNLRKFWILLFFSDFTLDRGFPYRAYTLVTGQLLCSVSRESTVSIHLYIYTTRVVLQTYDRRQQQDNILYNIIPLSTPSTSRTNHCGRLRYMASLPGRYASAPGVTQRRRTASRVTRISRYAPYIVTLKSAFSPF